MMIYMNLARALALQESHALRGYARWGVNVPQSRPVDRWAEWCRKQHGNSATFRRVA